MIHGGGWPPILYVPPTKHSHPTSLCYALQLQGYNRWDVRMFGTNMWITE